MFIGDFSLTFFFFFPFALMAIMLYQMINIGLYSDVWELGWKALVCGNQLINECQVREWEKKLSKISFVNKYMVWCLIGLRSWGG